MDKIKGKYVKEILNVIYKSGKNGLYNKNITEAMNIGPVPISRGLKVLEREGLVNRQEEKPISVRYTITKKGVKIKTKIDEFNELMDSKTT